MEVMRDDVSRTQGHRCSACGTFILWGDNHHCGTSDWEALARAQIVEQLTRIADALERMVGRG